MAAGADDARARFEVLNELGRGGMGLGGPVDRAEGARVLRVWLDASDPSEGRGAAFQLLRLIDHEGVAAEPGERERLRRRVGAGHDRTETGGE